MPLETTMIVVWKHNEPVAVTMVVMALTWRTFVSDGLHLQFLADYHIPVVFPYKMIFDQLAKKMPSLLLNPNVNHQLHKIQSPVHIPSQPNPIHYQTSHF